MDPPTKPDLNQSLLDVARDGKARDLRHILAQEIDIFTTRNGLNALRLAIEGSREIGDCEYVEKIKCILEKMVKDNCYIALRWIGEVCDWLNTLSGQDSLLRSREFEVRRLLSETLEEAFRAVAQLRNQQIESTRGSIDYWKTRMGELQAEGQRENWHASELRRRALDPNAPYPLWAAMHAARQNIYNFFSTPTPLKEEMLVGLVTQSIIISAFCFLLWRDSLK